MNFSCQIILLVSIHRDKTRRPRRNAELQDNGEMKLRTSKNMPRWLFLSLDLVHVTLEFQPGAPRKVRCFKLTYDGQGGTMKPAEDDCLRRMLAAYVPDDDDAQEESDDEDGSMVACDGDDGKDESGGEVIEDDSMLFPDQGAEEDSGEDVDAGGDEDTARFSAARTMSSGRRMHSVPSVCS